MATERPWPEIGTGQFASSDLALLGIPFDGAVSNFSGAAKAPDRMRQLSEILPPFSEEGLDLRALKLFDRGNIVFCGDWAAYFKKVRQEAVKTLHSAPFSLFIGGDHSVTIPLGSAFSEVYSDKKIGMIHFDSHCDLMDQYDHSNWSHACPQRRFLELPNAGSDRMALIGIRSYEAEELDFLKENPGITLISAGQFLRCSFPERINLISQAVGEAEAVYLSLDIDVLDPAFAPGTGTPEAGGLATRDVFELVRELIALLPVKAMDLVEVSPPLDQSDITSWAALKIIYELFGALSLK